MPLWRSLAGSRVIHRRRSATEAVVAGPGILPKTDDISGVVNAGGRVRRAPGKSRVVKLTPLSGVLNPCARPLLS